MRFVEGLCTSQIRLLTRIHKESKKHHVRQRAHCILLSYQGFCVSELAKIFGKTKRAIYSWLDLWDTTLWDCMTRKAEGESQSSMMINVVR